MVYGLERELGDRVQVLRLNVLSPVGRAAASAYAVRAVPTFVLFDAGGEMVYYQVGFPVPRDLQADYLSDDGN